MHEEPGLVWIPRPAPVDAAYTASFESAGFKVWLEPLMLIQAISDETKITAYHSQLGSLAEQDAAIFISANAASQFFSIASASQKALLQKLKLFAVGPATADVLRQHGCSADIPETLMSSEGLLQLPQLQNVSGWNISIFRGVGGRGFLQQQLAQRGAKVQHVEIYERVVPPHISEELAANVAAKKLQAVMVGSIETFDNLVSLVPNISRQIILVAPSARVAQHIRLQGFTRVANAASAASADMVETLQKTLKT